MGGCASADRVAAAPPEAVYADGADEDPADEKVEKPLDIKPPSFYIESDSIHMALEEEVEGLRSVLLLKSTWVLDRADQLAKAKTAEERRRLALPHRQELERLHPEAYYTAKEVRELPTKEVYGLEQELLRVGSGSHAWMTPEHPDPEGQQLLNLASVVRRAQRGELPSQQGDGLRLAKLPSEFALFYDWCSLLQKGPDGTARTEAEQAAFGKALSTMQLWYAHQQLFTISLSKLPDGCEATPYMERGWPTVEMAWSMLVKQNYTAGGDLGSWPMLLDAGRECGEPIRRAPVHPDRLEALLSDKRFTSRKADLPLVERLYRETTLSVLGGAEKLVYERCGFDAEQAARLVEVLPLATKATVLNLADNPLRDAGVAAVCGAIKQGALPELEKLSLYQCGVGEEGFRAIGELLGSGAAPKLRIIVVSEAEDDERSSWIEMAKGLAGERAGMLNAFGWPESMATWR